ncbi:hypothetical protein GQX74_000688 [Glossina fuscipes]|nr:hypothetical protein GQX74_000688 [Glossina fuscipes]
MFSWPSHREQPVVEEIKVNPVITCVLNILSRISASMFVLLAIFQLAGIAEHNACCNMRKEKLYNHRSNYISIMMALLKDNNFYEDTKEITTHFITDPINAIIHK